MSLTLDQKKAIVAEVAEVAARALSAIASEYRGMTVEQLTALRIKARESGVYMRVVKNTLARRAIQGTAFECMQHSLTGPLILAFSQDDPGAAARLLKDFTKTNDKCVIKVLALGGQILPPTELDRMANMPTREQALSMFMGCLRAPLDKLARTLNEVPGKLVRTLEALRQQKEASA